jgi:hypothetical protein
MHHTGLSITPDAYATCYHLTKGPVVSNYDDYLALETEISNIPAESVCAPDIPVEVLAKEGEQVCDWVQLDKNAFDGVNFDWTVVTSLKQRIGAAIYAEATWSNKRLLQQDSLKTFNTMRLGAEKLRSDVLAALAFACFGMPDVEKTISDIRQGSSHADLILDLTRISVLCNQYARELQKINFDFKLLDEVTATAGEMGTLLGQADSGKLLECKERVMRDKAYTSLKNAIDKVRTCGKYVCRSNPERLKGYFSEFIRSKNRQRQNVKQSEVTTQGATAK